MYKVLHCTILYQEEYARKDQNIEIDKILVTAFNENFRKYQEEIPTCGLVTLII